MFFGKNVVSLSEKDFTGNRLILPKNKEGGIVAIVAPWCGYCKSMKMEYQQLADYIGNVFYVCYIDSTEHPELVKKLKVKGFPTIKYIKKDGTLVDYNGGRIFNNFVSNICNEFKIGC